MQVAWEWEKTLDNSLRLLAFGGCAVCVSCGHHDKVVVIDGRTNLPARDAMVYAWRYHLEKSPSAYIAVSDELGVASFGSTCISGNLTTIVVMKEGYFPVRAIASSQPIRIIQLAEDQKVGDEQFEKAVSFYSSIRGQSAIDVPNTAFRTPDKRLSIDDLTQGLDSQCGDMTLGLRRRWVEAFEEFVERRN
jgi:hypothetical protein